MGTNETKELTKLEREQAIDRLSLRHRSWVELLPVDRWMSLQEVWYCIGPTLQRGSNHAHLVRDFRDRIHRLGLASASWNSSRNRIIRISRDVHKAIIRRRGGPDDELQKARRKARERGAGVGGAVSGHNPGPVLGGRSGH